MPTEPRPTWVLVVLTALVASCQVNAAMRTSARQARANADEAAPAFTEIYRWLHEVALPKVDPKTKLFRATGDSWNYRDTAADCYPFFAWAAYFTDRSVFEGAVRDVLRAETKLCSHHGAIPVNYDLAAGKKQEDQPRDAYIFGASEYMKDGLVAVVEAAGVGEWSQRMQAIGDALWEHADIDTPYGKLVSDNLEVNGDHMQVLLRLFGLTGDRRYLEYAQRIADYYLNDPNFVPRNLRDHGCELIGGLGLLQGVLSTVDSEREKHYRPMIRKMLDAILERGLNSDGLMLNTLADTPGPHDDKPLTDNWGYNYVSFYCYYLVTCDTKYRDVIRTPLVNLAKPKYHLYPWEGKNIDGHADSIEGGLYLLSFMPVQEGLRWADREVADALIGKPIPGTSKFECNAIRTVTLYALSKTLGIHVPQWRDDLRLGAARNGDGVEIFVAAKQSWEGKLVFDIPRHKHWLHFEHDWPRINYLPESFTVEPDARYVVRIGAGKPQPATGQSLHEGLAVQLEPGQEIIIKVDPVDRVQRPSACSHPAAASQPMRKSSGPRGLPDGALAVMNAFAQALRDSAWNDALADCSPEVRAAVAEYKTPADFFEDVVPVDRVLALSQYPVCESRGQEFFRSFVRLTEPQDRPTISWTWTLARQDQTWVIDFKTTPLKTWIEQETVRINRRDAERRAKIDALMPKLAGLKTRLTPLNTEYVVGEPMLFRLELINEGEALLLYDDQQVAVNHSMIVTDGGGQPVPYIAQEVQTGGGYEPVKPGQTVVLFDKLDLAAQYAVWDPGTYSVQFSGRGISFGEGTPGRFPSVEVGKAIPSNVVKIHVKAK